MKVKIELKSKQKSLDISDLEGTFDEVLNTVQKWKDKYETLCEDGEFCVVEINYHGYDVGVDLFVNYYRYETDQEVQVREHKLSLKKEKQQQKEIAQLKALREKYPNI